MSGITFDFTGQVVLVTGAAGNLGQAVTGKINQRGGVDWSFARSRGPAI